MEDITVVHQNGLQSYKLDGGFKTRRTFRAFAWGAAPTLEKGDVLPAPPLPTVSGQAHRRKEHYHHAHSRPLFIRS